MASVVALDTFCDLIRTQIVGMLHMLHGLKIQDCPGHLIETLVAKLCTEHPSHSQILCPEEGWVNPAYQFEYQKVISL